MNADYRNVRICLCDLKRFKEVKGEFSTDKMRTLLRLHDKLTPVITGSWKLEVKKYHKLREDDLPRMRH